MSNLVASSGLLAWTMGIGHEEANASLAIVLALEKLVQMSQVLEFTAEYAEAAEETHSVFSSATSAVSAVDFMPCRSEVEPR